ncbi:hypothetical protein ROLI_009000 [Roseobacter fucihabitans]|uniref:Thioredoxin domain-containing protein n=1 Tax=Roseobacter fucihabitans TaxID=1537242 RepID=A0ABZ2BP99_9RHOB|nr:thioredoxin family protein [Roseobacter litoralis]MBC6967385.1 hypothetical protein [Roseobacter litoralis]
MSKSRNTRTGKSKGLARLEPTRRDVIKLLRNGMIATVAVAGGGYFAMGSFRVYAAEHDLSRVGQGKPVVVQVHDPQCPTCTALQKQARKALYGFGECDLVYLIADITTVEGRAFAVRHGVGNVTLLLFDGRGGLQQAVEGLHSRDELDVIFKAHHGRFATS